MDSLQIVYCFLSKDFRITVTIIRYKRKKKRYLNASNLFQDKIYNAMIHTVLS